MGKCAACGYSHSHPGEKTCKFSKDAKEKCRVAGVEETRWKEFLDVDTLRELTKSEDPTDAAQFASLADFNILKQSELDRKAQMDKLESDISTLSTQMMNLLSKIPGPGVAPVVHPGGTLPVVPPTVTLPSVTPPVTLPHPMATPVTTVTTTSVTTMVTGVTSTTTPSTWTSAFIPSTSHWRPPVTFPPSVSTTWSTGTSHHSPHIPGGVSTIPPTSSGLPFLGGYPPLPSPAGHVHYATSAGGGPVPTGMIPAAYLSNPLTPALQGISDVDSRQPGMSYRPEYYVLHEEEGEPIKQISHKMMTYRKLIHGMVLVAKNIRANGGDIDKYLSHMDYVTRHGKNEDYQDSAYIEYDKMVVDDFVRNPSEGIKACNVMASSFCFHDVTRVHKSSTQISTPKKKNKIRSKVSNRQGDSVPDDYPPENCFYWNYRSCVMSNCNRNHVCRICGENHKAVNCTHRKQ